MYKLIYTVELTTRPTFTARRKAESKVAARELKSKLLSKNIKEGRTIYSGFQLFDIIENRIINHNF